MVAAGLATASAAPASAAFIVCAPGVNTFVWDGNLGDTPGQVGDNRNWADAYNWDTDCIPGLLNQPHDDNVTIPLGAAVRLNDGESADVASLTNNGSLTITKGGALVTYGDSTSSVMLLQGILAGTGRFTVTKTLTWQSTSGGAATMSTRRCGAVLLGVPVDCSAPPASIGTTVVNPGAKLVINGRGVNFSDHRVIENHGTTTVSGAGYIAADYGTGFRNLRAPAAVQPKFQLANDGGYYQGFAIAGFGLSTFTNSGLVTKIGGTAAGVSIIDAQFSQSDPGSTYTGTTQVKIGTLTIYQPGNDIVQQASVKQGATFGNGGPPGPCDPVNHPELCGLVAPTGSDPEVATVQLTKPGTTSSKVAITEVSGVPVVSGQRGVPVQIETPSAQADPTNPLRFRILLDSSLLLLGETPAAVAANAVVARQVTTTVAYAALPNCEAVTLSSTIPACVSRTLSASETTAIGNGDVVIVINSLANSRYRVSKVGAA